MYVKAQCLPYARDYEIQLAGSEPQCTFERQNHIKSRIRVKSDQVVVFPSSNGKIQLPFTPRADTNLGDHGHLSYAALHKGVATVRQLLLNAANVEDQEVKMEVSKYMQGAVTDMGAEYGFCTALSRNV